MLSAQTISVVIPTYNCSRYLAEALESVFAQTYPVHEVIIVDDGSTDAIEKVIRPFRGRVTYIRQDNKGASVARNLGLAQASGSFIALLDADDVWLPRKLGAQIDALVRYPEATASFTPVTEKDGWAPCEKAICPPADVSNDAFWMRLWSGNFIQPSTVIMRHEAVQAAGLFDEGIRFCEDWEYWFRLLKLGPFVQIPEALCYYRAHPNQMTRNAYFEAVYLRKARLRIIADHGARLEAAGVPCSQQVRQVQERYRQEILGTYFRRQLGGARRLLWAYLVQHPGDFEVFKYAILSLMPRSLLVKLRGA
jgi:glycosyltransferase involved in cell wall biosynthesis